VFLLPVTVTGTDTARAVTCRPVACTVADMSVACIVAFKVIGRLVTVAITARPGTCRLESDTIAAARLVPLAVVIARPVTYRLIACAAAARLVACAVIAGSIASAVTVVACVGALAKIRGTAYGGCLVTQRIVSG
jgi:hypothetical protein